MFKKNLFTKADDIICFESNDSVAIKVKDFYEDDPFPNYKKKDNIVSILKSGDNNQYTYNLKKFIGNDKNILEVGAGTCQLSNYLSIGSNNRIIAFDLNINSLKLGSNFAKKNGIKNVEFVCGDIFDDIFEDNYFDIVLCNGVLHHTKNTQAALKESIKYLKKDGYILVGLYNKIGRIRTHIRRYLYKFLGKKFIILLDPVLRKIPEDSQDKIDAWIKDQYEHPVERSHSFDEVLNWFNDFGIQYINSYPTCGITDIHNNDEVFVNFFNQGNKRTFFDRILSQFTMIFNRQGSEGALFLFLGRKS